MSGRIIFLLLVFAGLGRAAAETLRPTLLEALPSPILLRGDNRIAYRDPLLIHEDGKFYLFYSYVKEEEDHLIYWYTAFSTSLDLQHWTEPKILTPKDQNLNYASPGNVIKVDGEWLLTLQTYPIVNFRRGDKLRFADDRARLFIMRSPDLITWGQPELIKVKGPNVDEKGIGKMIDPFLLRDKDIPASGGVFISRIKMYTVRGRSILEPGRPAPSNSRTGKIPA